MRRSPPIANRGRVLIGLCLAALVAVGRLTFAADVHGIAADTIAAVSDEPACTLASPIGPLAYTPGRGLRLGHMPITLGGYSNVNLVRNEGGPARLSLDDFSLFVIADPHPRLRLFSELEVEELLTLDSHGHGGTATANFVTERLFGDLTLSDQFVLRAGKFLTPVGRWNLIHVQPLVWTTSRPLVTFAPFDPHTTGAMLFGSLFPATGRVTYTLYGQFLNQLDPASWPVEARRSAGGRLEYAVTGGPSVGASYLTFESGGDWQHLGGLDTLWRRDRVEVMGEAVYSDAPRRWGLYLQPVVRLWSQLYVVGRYEHYGDQARDTPPAADLVVAGVAFKPVPYLILKGEYLFADHPVHDSPPGFKSSVAILF